MMARSIFLLANLFLLSLPLAAAQELQPPLPGADVPAAAVQEELTRGPVHEAFAEQINLDPVDGMVIAEPPPEPVNEVPPEFKPEGENIVWIPGYWWWDDTTQQYLWVSGVWRAIPPDQQWVPGYWSETDGGYQWVSGFWTNADPQQLRYQDPPPESLENGPSSPAPAADHFWSPGFWDADYQWHPGFWQPVQDQWVWIPSHWVPTPSGCVFVAGHWDYHLGGRGQLFAPVQFASYIPQTVYQPQCALDTSAVALHLFVRPNRRTYCFGDWYDDCRPERQIYTYWNYHTRPRGYCPLYAQSRARHARKGINLTFRLSSWHNYYAKHHDYRPPRTYRAQNTFVRHHSSYAYTRQSTLGARLLDLARGTDRYHAGGNRTASSHRLVHIDRGQQRRETERAHRVQELAQDRARLAAQVRRKSVLHKDLTERIASDRTRGAGSLFRNDSHDHSKPDRTRNDGPTLRRSTPERSPAARAAVVRAQQPDKHDGERHDHAAAKDARAKAVAPIGAGRRLPEHDAKSVAVRTTGTAADHSASVRRTETLQRIRDRAAAAAAARSDRNAGRRTAEATAPRLPAAKSLATGAAARAESLRKRISDATSARTRPQPAATTRAGRTPATSAPQSANRTAKTERATRTSGSPGTAAKASTTRSRTTPRAIGSRSAIRPPSTSNTAAREPRRSPVTRPATTRTDAARSTPAQKAAAARTARSAATPSRSVTPPRSRPATSSRSSRSVTPPSRTKPATSRASSSRASRSQAPAASRSAASRSSGKGRGKKK